METWIAAQPGIIAKRQARIEELSRMPDRSDFGTADSHYLSEAAKISGSGDYWIRPNELFARAFESVIFDRLEAMGARSDYLVHGVEEDRFADAGCWRGNPYPSGEERARIASALDGLFEAVVPRLNRDVEPEQDLGPRL